MTFTHRQPAALGYRVSVDCGGTFTDGVLFGEGSRVWLAKADSTPRDPTAGTTECIARLARQIDLDLPALLAEAPDDAQLVVFHSAVFSYVSPDHRRAFAAVLAEAEREGALARGQLVSLTGFGSGFSWASAVIRW